MYKTFKGCNRINILILYDEPDFLVEFRLFNEILMALNADVIF